MDPTAHLWTSAVVFAATDIDDLVILTAFFADLRLRRGAIVAGQFLGIGTLLGASLLAAAASLAVPPHWPALLGLVPLGIGLWKLPDLWRKPHDADDQAAGAERAGRRGSTGAQILAVAAVTIANGGDNLGVYIPLFARELSVWPIYLVVFALMTAVWCWMGYAFVRHPAGAALTQRLGHRILPVVLIALGAWILWDARLLL
jgi:cadmium resistance protein CadD (predicted permease)